MTVFIISVQVRSEFGKFAYTAWSPVLSELGTAFHFSSAYIFPFTLCSPSRSRTSKSLIFVFPSSGSLVRNFLSIKGSNYGEFLKDKNVLLCTWLYLLSAYKYAPNLESLLTQQYVCIMCTLWSDNTCVFTRFHSVKNANAQLIWSSAHEHTSSLWMDDETVIDVDVIPL
jgi:hypothetical protein